MEKYLHGIILTLIITLVGGAMYYGIKNEKTGSRATSFEECVSLGNPVMESYPRQCRDASGTLFVETIETRITYTNASEDMIVVTSPLPNEEVGSSITLSGKARGYWFFEASFPIRAISEDGSLLAQGIAQAQDEWMTTEFVPFNATLTLPTSYKGKVTLILSKDNPSGMPEKDASISFVVNTATTADEQKMTSIKLYYYNPSLDLGPGGPTCSEKGLVAVTRSIPLTITPLQDAVRLLLKEPLTKEEETSGLTNEFPLEEVTLESASLTDGELTLTFNDPLAKTSGGSCRASILRAQIEATAKEWDTVKTIKILPEDTFQP